MKILMRINVVVVEEPSPGVGIYSLHQNFSEVKPIPPTTISMATSGFSRQRQSLQKDVVIHFIKFLVFLVFQHDLLFTQLETVVVSLSAAPLHEVPNHKKVKSNKQS